MESDPDSIEDCHREVIHYDYIRSTPLGTILVAASKKGVCAILIGSSGPGAKREKLKERFPGRKIARDPARLERTIRRLRDYLAGSSDELDIPLDLSCVDSPFRRRVLSACRRIPFGCTTSYGELARRVGSPRAARAVGRVMATNPLPIVIPCHRVVSSSGALGGYTGGVRYKKELLSLEGVRLKRGKVLS